METKLYVGNLSYDATEEELKTLFSQAGVVQSVAIIKDRETSRSKGFAFIEMSNQAEAQAAISQLNGKPYRDRALTVNIARPREERSGFGGGAAMAAAMAGAVTVGVAAIVTGAAAITGADVPGSLQIKKRVDKRPSAFFVITMPVENLPYGQSPCAGARRSSNSVRAFQKNFQYMNTASEYRTMTEK